MLYVPSNSCVCTHARASLQNTTEVSAVQYSPLTPSPHPPPPPKKKSPYPAPSVMSPGDVSRLALKSSFSTYFRALTVRVHTPWEGHVLKTGSGTAPSFSLSASAFAPSWRFTRAGNVRKS